MATTKAQRRLKLKHPKKRLAVVHSAGQSKAAQAGPARTTMMRADNKGRVLLGGRFANRSFISEQLNDTEIVLKLARVIPESEAWLYDNAEALAAIRTGLAQARAGDVTQSPDVEGDIKLAAELED